MNASQSVASRACFLAACRPDRRPRRRLRPEAGGSRPPPSPRHRRSPPRPRPATSATTCSTSTPSARTALTPEIATNYGIARSANRALVNISMVKKAEGTPGVPVAGKVTVQAVNLNGQFKDLTLREVREGDAIYYIGDVAVARRRNAGVHRRRDAGERDAARFRSGSSGSSSAGRSAFRRVLRRPTRRWPASKRRRTTSPRLTYSSSATLPIR